MKNDIKTCLLLREEYDRLITEKLSISDHVTKVSNEIVKIFKRGQKNKYLKNYDFIGYLDIIWDFTKSYPKGGANGESDMRKAELDENELLINCTLKLSGYFGSDDKTNFDYLELTIFHEVEHLYQCWQKLKNDRFLNHKNIETGNYSKETIKKSTLYVFGKENLDSKNPYINSVATIFYLNEDEQDAIVNNLYNYLNKTKNLDINNLYDIYFDSDACKKLKTLKNIQKSLQYVDINDNQYKEMVNLLKGNYMVNFNLDKTKKLLEYYIKRFEGKIGKVLTLIKDEKKIMREYFYPQDVNYDNLIKEKSKFNSIVNYNNE